MNDTSAEGILKVDGIGAHEDQHLDERLQHFLHAPLLCAGVREMHRRWVESDQDQPQSGDRCNEFESFSMGPYACCCFSDMDRQNSQLCAHVSFSLLAWTHVKC